MNHQTPPTTTTTTLTTIVETGLAAYFGGYLLAESAFFEPARNHLTNKLEHRQHPAADWLLDGVGCSTCAGVWATFFTLAARRNRYTRWLATVLAGNGLALAWTAVEAKLLEGNQN